MSKKIYLSIYLFLGIILSAFSQKSYSLTKVGDGFTTTDLNRIYALSGKPLLLINTTIYRVPPGCVEPRKYGVSSDYKNTDEASDLKDLGDASDLKSLEEDNNLKSTDMDESLKSKGRDEDTRGKGNDSDLKNTGTDSSERNKDQNDASRSGDDDNASKNRGDDASGKNSDDASSNKNSGSASFERKYGNDVTLIRCMKSEDLMGVMLLDYYGKGEVVFYEGEGIMKIEIK